MRSGVFNKQDVLIVAQALVNNAITWDLGSENSMYARVGDV
jgi:hypothetical protein